MKRIDGCLIKRNLAKPTTERKPIQSCSQIASVHKALNASKFAPSLEGPYTMKKVYDDGCFCFAKPESKELLLPLT